jgi:hypothetical protein
MRSVNSVACVSAMTAILFGGASFAQAQVSFSDVRDAVPSRFFESATTAASATEPNRLIIGFDSGFDFSTFTYTDFRASALPFSNRSAADTLSFVATAPQGYYVSKITYTQRGSGSTYRYAVQAGVSQWVVAGYPSNLGTFTSNPNLTGSVDLTALQLTSVPVSITVSLFAASAGTVSVTSADVVVEVKAIDDGTAPVAGTIPEE